MRKLLSTLVLTAATFAAQAQTSVPNTFTAGTPAKASEVNANFQALVTAINGLNTRVSKLEGKITSADMIGTYVLHRLQTELGTGRVAVYTSGPTTLKLEANGSALLSGSTEKGHQLNLPQNTLTAINRSDGSATIPWSLTGSKLSFAGQEFSVADGGRLLIGTSSNPADGTNVILLIVRVD